MRRIGGAEVAERHRPPHRRGQPDLAAGAPLSRVAPAPLPRRRRRGSRRRTGHRTAARPQRQVRHREPQQHRGPDHDGVGGEACRSASTSGLGAARPRRGHRRLRARRRSMGWPPRRRPCAARASARLAAPISPAADQRPTGPPRIGGDGDDCGGSAGRRAHQRGPRRRPEAGQRAGSNRRGDQDGQRRHGRRRARSALSRATSRRRRESGRDAAARPAMPSDGGNACATPGRGCGRILRSGRTVRR